MKKTANKALQALNLSDFIKPNFEKCQVGYEQLYLKRSSSYRISSIKSGMLYKPGKSNQQSEEG